MPARFLILGSASAILLRQTSESLAGRVERIVIGGFSLHEVGAEARDDLWRRGGFPLSYLATRAKRQRDVAQQLRADAARARSAAVGGAGAVHGATPRLDRRRALPRPDVERRRRRPHAGRERGYRAPLPRPARRRLHGQAAAALACQPAQAPGEVAQGVRARQRRAAHAARHRAPRGAREPPQGRASRGRGS